MPLFSFRSLFQNFCRKKRPQKFQPNSIPLRSIPWRKPAKRCDRHHVIQCPTESNHVTCCLEPRDVLSLRTDAHGVTWQVDRFAQTPVMSTYLVAVVVSDFASETRVTPRGTKVSVLL